MRPVRRTGGEPADAAAGSLRKGTAGPGRGYGAAHHGPEREDYSLQTAAGRPGAGAFCGKPGPPGTAGERKNPAGPAAGFAGIGMANAVSGGMAGVNPVTANTVSGGVAAANPITANAVNPTAGTQGFTVPETCPFCGTPLPSQTFMEYCPACNADIRSYYS